MSSSLPLPLLSQPTLRSQLAEAGVDVGSGVGQSLSNLAALRDNERKVVNLPPKTCSS